MEGQIDWTGIALAITATGGAIAIVINALKTAKTMKETKETVEETKDLAVAIDNAVNNKLPGAQTIADEVSDLHGDRPPSPPGPRA